MCRYCVVYCACVTFQCISQSVVLVITCVVLFVLGEDVDVVVLVVTVVGVEVVDVDVEGLNVVDRMLVVVGRVVVVPVVGMLDSFCVEVDVTGT